jgi:hypothetical protein
MQACRLHQTGSVMRILLCGLALLLAAMSAATPAATAHPSEIIILRHPEKVDQLRLCTTGRDRTEALAHQYLFAPGVPPAAFIAITIHSLELATPAADSWKLPVTIYSVLPTSDKETFTRELNSATRSAALKVMTDPSYTEKPVVMVWEHNHIANAWLAFKFRAKPVTLRQLFNLARLRGVPRYWPAQNYDYFWIVKFGNPASDIPTGFQMIKQVFQPPYNHLPQNDWGADEPSGAQADCIKVGPDYLAY